MFSYEITSKNNTIKYKVYGKNHIWVEKKPLTTSELSSLKNLLTDALQFQSDPFLIYVLIEMASTYNLIDMDFIMYLLSNENTTKEMINYVWSEKYADNNFGGWGYSFYKAFYCHKNCPPYIKKRISLKIGNKIHDFFEDNKLINDLPEYKVYEKENIELDNYLASYGFPQQKLNFLVCNYCKSTIVKEFCHSYPEQSGLECSECGHDIYYSPLDNQLDNQLGIKSNIQYFINYYE